MTSTTATPGEAERGSRLGAHLVVALVFLSWTAHASSIIGLLAGNATAQIAIHFRTTQIAWFTLAPSLLGLFLSPAIYWAATRYGKRRVMLSAAVLALFGDVIAALATSFPLLLLGRAISGIYAGTAVLAYAIVRDIVPKKSVGSASGAVAGGIAVVGVAGPFLSAGVLDSFGYRGALWTMVCLTAVTVVALLFFIPESPVRDQSKRFDWIGSLLLGTGVTAVVYGIGQGSDWGWTSGRVIGLLGGGLAVILVFVIVESRIEHPLFPMAMLKRRPFWGMIAATSVVYCVTSVGTVGYLLALYPKIPHLSAGLGWSATHYALVGLPGAPILLGTALFAGRLAKRFDPRLLLATGSALFAVSMVLSVYFHYNATQMIATSPVGSIGMGLVITTLPILVISAVEPREQALGNGAQSIASGIFIAVATQVAYVVMAQKGLSSHGAQFYSDASFKNAYWLFAGIGALGSLSCFLMPRMKRMDEVESGQAPAPSAEEEGAPLPR
ncbi:MFS transporter [Streptomyces mirabilis]|uniref:MFS transporter n=1 Tax=Streptomyces mirabilis TaxID=68239 RepID=UPI0036C0E1F9